MMSLGLGPTDDVAAKALIAEALACSERMDWDAATPLLEAAALYASNDLLGGIIETLGAFYLRANRYDKLGNLIAYSTRATPSLAIGCLLLERNRLLGLRIPAGAKYSFQEVLSVLRDFIAQGRYSLAELNIVCSLLVQIGNAKMAVQLLDGMINVLSNDRKGGSLDEELVASVLTLALEKKMKREVDALIGKLERLSPTWSVRAARFRILLGKALLDSVPTGVDKVVDFLAYSGVHRDAKRGRHGR